MRKGLGRRGILAAMAAGGAGIVAGGIARAQQPGSEAPPEVSWRLTSSFPKSLDLMFGGADTVARVTAELTGGRFRLQVFPPGEVVPGLGALDAVQAGTVEAAQTSLDYSFGKDPAFALPTAFPFGLNARGQSAFHWGGAGEEILRTFLAGYGLVGFPAGNTGAQMGGFFRKPLGSAAELAGLKIRIGGLGGQVLQRLGAVPQATPKAEMAAALQAGTLDAATWVSPYDDEKLGTEGTLALPKVAPNYYYPGWWRGASAIHVVVNKAKFEALPAPFQAALRAACAIAEAEMLGRYDTRNPPALRRLVVAGAQLKPFPQDVLDAAWKATNDTFRDIADGNPAFKAMLEALLAFRSDEYLWWQVGEYTFDNFMIRQRAKG